MSALFNISAQLLIPSDVADGLGGYNRYWYVQDAPIYGMLGMPGNRELIENKRNGVQSLPKWVGEFANIKVGYRLRIDNVDYDVTESKTEKRMITQPPYIVCSLRQVDAPSETNGSAGTLIVGSDTDVIQGIAGEILGGQRLVVTQNGKLYHADKDTPAHINTVLGLTLSSAVVGENAKVMREGPVIEPSWNWEPDKPVYLGNNGLLTQAVPESGFMLVIGIAETSKKIIMELQPPIKLT